MDLKYGDFIIAADELGRYNYCCNPKLCGKKVCCAKFDIAITLEEMERIKSFAGKLYKYCPWLKEYDDFFLKTSCEIFIRKQDNGHCLFNYNNIDGGYYCAIHSAALEAGQNPFSWKPLNCSLWPFLRDGSNRLEIDDPEHAPCLNAKKGYSPDPELLKMLEDIESAQSTK